MSPGRRAGALLMVLGALAVVVGVTGEVADDGSPAGQSATDEGSPHEAPPRASTTTTAGPDDRERPPPRSRDGEEPPVDRVEESPDDFYALLGAAFRRGDLDTAVGRLHPFVLDVYGEEQCRAFLDSLGRDRSFEVIAVHESAPFTFGTGEGLALAVPVATRIDVSQRIGARSVSQPAHLAPDDEGRLQWFTDCGTPR